MKHACHALACEVAVPASMFMCARHWRLLPKEHKDAIWASYVPGQEVRRDPSPAYLDAAMAAINWMSHHEGRR